jgi:hypothetical protein
MDMYSRNQYLLGLRTEYLITKSKKKRGELLDEAEKRTKLNRKYLIEKLKPKSNLDKNRSQRKKRTQYYDNSVKPALVRMWEIFDYPCGQRLKPLLESETDRMRRLNELLCSDLIAEKLKQIGSATIDRKLKHQKEIEYLKRKYHHKIHPLLYQKIPVKVFAEQNRQVLGNIQMDLVEHCGQSAAGEFICTLSNTDIFSGWWEGQAIIGRCQERTFEGLKQSRLRFPFQWLAIHSDNDTAFINWHLLRYTEKEGLGFSRSRPYKKNDNCIVEQKNWTHVKKFVGYLRYDTETELNTLNDLYRNELRLFKNFFQPVIKLISKERLNGKIHRQYDIPKTPYQRVMETREISPETKRQLKTIYQSLNPAQLKRTIDKKLDIIYKAYREKNSSSEIALTKKLSVSFLPSHLEPVLVR